MELKNRRFGSPVQQHLNQQEISVLQEPDICRKKGEKVEDALYRDHIKRNARQKLISEQVAQGKTKDQNQAKITVKSQQLAIQKLERDLEDLIKNFSFTNQDKSQRFVGKEQLVQLFREVELFRELESKDPRYQQREKSKSQTRRSVSPVKSVSPIRQDQHRKTLRLKQEREFLNTLWNCLISPSNMNEAEFEIVNEVFKIIFNHYIPSSKQVSLLNDLQQLVSSVDNGYSYKLLKENQIEERVIKPFQSMYPHYYNLNNIAKTSHQEKLKANIKEHYKEFTFKPKINPESANMDMQNITNVYAQLQKAQQQNLHMKQAKQMKSNSDDIEIDPQITDSDSDNNENNMSEITLLDDQKQFRINNGLNKYLIEHKSDRHLSNISHIKSRSQLSALTNQASTKTVLYDQNGDKSRSRTPNRNTKEQQQKSTTPERGQRYEYLYIQEKIKQEKIKQQISDKFHLEVADCTFQPNIKATKSRNASISRATDAKSQGQTPQQSQDKRFELLYKSEMEKKTQKKEVIQKIKEEQEKQKIAECTFKPKISSKSPIDPNRRREKTPPPNGYEDTVNRMRMANQEKLRQKNLMDNLGRAKKYESDPSKNQKPFQLSYQEKIEKKEKKETNSDVLIFMEILVKQGQKVKLKIKRNDSPRSVALNFSKIYGLNQKSEEALCQIITEQMQNLHFENIKGTQDNKEELQGLNRDIEDSLDSSFKQHISQLSNIKQQVNESLGMIDEHEVDDEEKADVSEDDEDGQKSGKDDYEMDIQNSRAEQ